MKRLLSVTAMVAIVCCLSGCMSTLPTAPAPRRDVSVTHVYTGSYGYGVEYVIVNNGYSYSYVQAAIDEITRRMVAEMRLDHLLAQRLLELNRRYFYVFHSMPNYSFGYYGFSSFDPLHGNPPYGPGHYGGANRPPYVQPSPGYTRRVEMSEKQLRAAADEYCKSVRSLVGRDPYASFQNNVRSSARSAGNSKVNAVRSAVPTTNGAGTVRSNATRSNATQTNATRSNATRSNATQTNATRSNATRSNATQTNATRSNATRGNATQTNATRSNATRSNATQSNANQGTVRSNSRGGNQSSTTSTTTVRSRKPAQ